MEIEADICPLGCPMCKEFYADDQTYCTNCGLLLPLPDELGRLMRKSGNDEEDVCNHEEDRQFAADFGAMGLPLNFCAYCGKKL